MNHENKIEEESITIELLQENDHPAYQNYVNNHPKSHYGQLLETKKLIEQNFKFQPLYIIAKLQDSIVGILPLFKCKSLLEGTRLVSIPFLPLGGPLTNNNQIESLLLTYAQELTNKHQASFCELRIQGYLESNNNTNNNEANNTSNFWNKQSPITNFFLDFKETPESTYNSLDKRVRYDIRKAKKHNIQVMVAKSNDNPKIIKNLLDDYYKIYLHTRKKRGVPSWPKSFFQESLNSLPSLIAVAYLPNNKASTTNKVPKNKTKNKKQNKKQNKKNPIAACFCFIEEKHKTIEYAFAGTNYKYTKLAPAYALISELINYGHTNNLVSLEFGGSTKQMNDGNLYAFKQRITNRTTPISYYFYAKDKKNIPKLKSNFTLYKIYGKIWSFLPKSIIKLISPYVLRQFH